MVATPMIDRCTRFSAVHVEGSWEVNVSRSLIYHVYKKVKKITATSLAILTNIDESECAKRVDAKFNKQ